MTLVHLTEYHCDVNEVLERELREGKISREQFAREHYEEIDYHRQEQEK